MRAPIVEFLCRRSFLAFSYIFMWGGLYYHYHIFFSGMVLFGESKCITQDLNICEKVVSIVEWSFLEFLRSCVVSMYVLFCSVNVSDCTCSQYVKGGFIVKFLHFSW